MPRKGENIYKCKDKRWEGRYITSYNTAGRVVYKSVYGKSYTEVKLKMRSHIEPDKITPIGISFAAWTESYLKSQERKTYHAEQLKQRLALGDQWIDSGKIFTSENGGVINPESLSGWFKNFVRRYNLPDIHFHNLRHTAATLLIANGVDVATVSKRLGHADKTTTLNIYTHAIKSADRAAADKLEDILTRSKIS